MVDHVHGNGVEGRRTDCFEPVTLSLIYRKEERIIEAHVNVTLSSRTETKDLNNSIETNH